MKIIKYRKRYPPATELLMEQNAITGVPTQKVREDLLYDEGVDITYTLQGMAPSKFRKFQDALLLAAYQEAERYKGEKYRFAKFEVRLNRTTKGRKTGISPTRVYTAAKHTDSEIMVYGEEALGYELPEDYKRKPFLINKVEEILDIPSSTSPGPFVEKQNPYKVVTMTICIRAGYNELSAADYKKMKDEVMEAENKKARDQNIKDTREDTFEKLKKGREEAEKLKKERKK